MRKARQPETHTVTPRHDVWSELVPLAEVRAPAVLRTMADRSVGLLLAVQPDCLGELAATVRACREHGVGLGLWPLLDDEDGRYVCARNAERFGEHLRETLRAAGEASPALREVVFDLEPPIVTSRAVLSAGLGAPAKWLSRAPRSSSAAAELAAQARLVRRHGLEANAVVAPLVLGDPRGERGPFQQILGTPVDGLGFDAVAVMAYTSLFEGYGRGLVRRADARALLRRTCLAAARRWPGRAAVALGLTGGGALGDERPYRSVDELAEDVAEARACGLGRLSLHGLEGILGSRRPEAWLDALVGDGSAAPPTVDTIRARALVGVGRAAALVAGPALWLRGRPDEPR